MWVPNKDPNITERSIDSQGHASLLYGIDIIDNILFGSLAPPTPEPNRIDIIHCQKGMDASAHAWKLTAFPPSRTECF